MIKSIPKVIHYCWFGGNPEPEDVKQCIASWRKILPNYKIKRWDEINYYVHKNQYMSDAYKEHKWAFVSDYCRIDVVHKYGGIYLDTDVEVIRSFDPLLSEQMFCGFESRDPLMFRKKKEVEQSVNFGLGFGAIAGHKVLKQILELYENLSFYNKDGSLNLIACPRYQTQILKRNGLTDNGETQRFDNGIAYSAEYFCPLSNITDKMLFLTDNTYSIHHFSVTWASKEALAERDLCFKMSHYMGFRLASKIAKSIYIIRKSLNI